jgi:hypothetical protein
LTRLLLFIGVLLSQRMLSAAGQATSGPLPIIDSEVVFSEGGFNSFCSLTVSDKWSIDLNSVDKMRGELTFQSRTPGCHQIPLHGPFRVEKTGRPDLPQYFQAKLVSSDEDNHERITIDVQSMGGDFRATKPPRTYRIIVITELNGFISGVAVLQGKSRD